MRKGRYGRGGADHHIHILEIVQHALVKLVLLGKCAANLRSCQFQSPFSVVDDVTVEQIFVLSQPLAMRGHKGETTVHLENVVDAREIRRAVLNMAEVDSERLGAVAKDGGDVFVDGTRPKVGRKGNPYRTEINWRQCVRKIESS